MQRQHRVGEFMVGGAYPADRAARARNWIRARDVDQELARRYPEFEAALRAAGPLPSDQKLEALAAERKQLAASWRTSGRKSKPAAARRRNADCAGAQSAYGAVDGAP